MGIPWRNARFGDYPSYSLASMVEKERRIDLYFSHGEKSLGLVIEAWEDPYLKEADLYVVAPDVLSGESWAISGELPSSVPHNTIYGIGTRCAEAKLERIRRLPRGTLLRDLTDILFH